MLKHGTVDFLAQALQMALHRAVQALAAHIQPQAAQHAGVYGLGQDDVLPVIFCNFASSFSREGAANATADTAVTSRMPLSSL